MHFSSSVAQVIHDLPGGIQRPRQARRRCTLRRRRLWPVLSHSKQIINPMNITPTEGMDTRGYFRQPRANIWSRNGGQPTRVTQLALVHFGLVVRQRLLATCLQFRRGVEKIRFFVKPPRINGTGMFTSRANSVLTPTKVFPLNPQLSQTMFRKTPPFNSIPGSPQPIFPSVCVAMAPSARAPDFWKT